MCSYNRRSGPLKVSIIVPCRNEVAHIRTLLDDISRQEGLDDFDWEAIIADGSSDDGSAQIVKAYEAQNPKIRLIENPGRIVSAGLNVAFGQARGDIILRMDAHTRYAPDYCNQCIKALFASGADNVGGPARTFSRSWIQRAIAAAFRSRFSTGGAHFHNPNYEGFVDTVPYGCWWRSTFKNIGMFDENLVCNQDDEFNLRLIRSGGKIWQTPEIRSWYIPRASLKSLFCQYFQYGFWKVMVIRKHRFPSSVRHLTPALFIASNILLVMTTIADLIVEIDGLTFLMAGGYLINGSYLLLSCGASILAGRRDGWSLIPILPLVFAIYHVSYGIGFLAGCVVREHSGNFVIGRDLDVY